MPIGKQLRIKASQFEPYVSLRYMAPRSLVMFDAYVRAATVISVSCSATRVIMRRCGPSTATEKKHNHLYVQGTWLFGDWDNALCAAGFDPEKMRRRRFWDQKSVLEKIRALRRQNVPLSANYAMKHHQGAFDAALREFGSWSRAVIAAGVITKAIPRKTRLGLLRELRDVMERSSAAIPEPFRVYLTHYFGSVRNAIAALKTDRKLLSGGWSKSKITATLARMHRSKEKLAYAAVRRDSPALVSAAEAYFGSWGRALHAAGIDPNLYFVHHTWRNRTTNRKQMQ